MSAKAKRLGKIFLLLFLFSVLLFSTSKVLHAISNDTVKQAEPLNESATDPIEKTHADRHSKFNAGELIVGHILDAHDWHIAGDHTNPFSIPLPIILYTDKGFDIFLSSAFHHRQEIVKAKYDYILDAKNHIIVVNHDGSINKEATSKIWDISITKNVLSMFITFGLMLWIFISIARRYTTNPNSAPKGIQSLIEPIIIFVRDEIAKVSIGEKKYKKYMPFLLTTFFFIWISNLLGLIPIFPGGANLTGNIAIPCTLAVIVFIIIMFTGNKNYWKHIFAMPGVPVGVLFLLTPIEILGVILKPLVLMIRLFANITAGHIIALSFFSLIFIFGEINSGLGLGVSVISLVFTVFMGMLELLVAFLQAYVFTLLSAMYFGSAVEDHHHEENH
jgi:F-type H+-transporting ATPase subunit a